MDPINDSLDNPMVLVIRESRANAWPQAKLILDTIADAAPYSEVLKSYYFIVKAERELFAKAMALIDLLGHTKALQIYINGTVKRNGWQLRQVVECFMKATKFDDSRKYCHLIHEHKERQYGGMAMTIQFNLVEPAESEEERDQSKVIRRTAVPCRLLFSHARYAIDEEGLDANGFAVQAIEEGIDMCPLFDAAGYAEVFPIIIGKDGRVEDGSTA